VGSAKIASIGIAVRRWVTYHGIALNVSTDPKCFNSVIPCGHPNEKITSVERELGYAPDMTKVKEDFVETFCRLFEYATEAKIHQRAFEGERPAWLVRPVPCLAAIDRMEERLSQLELATACQSAHCPNLGECFERGTPAFMILGTRCTSGCRSCAVDKGVPDKVDLGEPERVARAAQMLGLKHVVVTSVTRDDLLPTSKGHWRL